MSYDGSSDDDYDFEGDAHDDLAWAFSRNNATNMMVDSLKAEVAAARAAKAAMAAASTSVITTTATNTATTTTTITTSPTTSAAFSAPVTSHCELNSDDDEVIDLSHCTTDEQLAAFCANNSRILAAAVSTTTATATSKTKAATTAAAAITTPATTSTRSIPLATIPAPAPPSPKPQRTTRGVTARIKACASQDKTYVPPPEFPLPAYMEEVTDLPSLETSTFKLVKFITDAINSGKSVTSRNKTLIKLAAAEIGQMMSHFHRSALKGDITIHPTIATATANAATATTDSISSASIMPPPSLPSTSPKSTTTISDAQTSPFAQLSADIKLCTSEVKKLRNRVDSVERLTRTYAQATKRPASDPAIPLVDDNAYETPAGIPPLPPVGDHAAHRATDVPPSPSRWQQHRQQQGRRPPPRPPTRPALIVKTKAATSNPGEAVTAFRKTVSFRESTYAPARVQPLSNNKLRVEFDSEDDRSDALRRINASTTSEIEVEIAKRLRPMFILKGISKDMPVDQLVPVILRQNPEFGGFTADDLIYKFKRSNNRNENFYNAVFIANPMLFRSAMQLGRVRLDHQKVHAEEFSPFLQCHTCLGFGHTKKYCRLEMPRCAYCAKTNHSEADCPEKDNPYIVSCYNCLSHNGKFQNKHNIEHRALSPSCPVYKAVKNRLQNNIDYGLPSP